MIYIAALLIPDFCVSEFRQKTGERQVRGLYQTHINGDILVTK